MRHDGRYFDQLREIKLETNVYKQPEGSVVVSFGDTQVICSATIEDSVPPFLKDTNTGWVSAEYRMLPRATQTRNKRESTKGKLKGRTMEIQRLIGRSLRSIVDLDKLGERSIIIDCDVVQADGGTRTASITGAFTALRLAIDKLLQTKTLNEDPIKEFAAAVSVGILPDETCVLDLDYEEDSSCVVDMNVVMTESGRFIEVQGNGEEATFDRSQLDELLLLGEQGINTLVTKQKAALYAKKEAQSVDEQTVVIATGNLGKAQEFTSMFHKAGYKVKTMKDFPELPDVAETGSTFEENARLKAETIANILQCPVLADDSGLQVEALHGMPGIYSARFAGEQKNDAANNAKLLYELTEVPDEQRRAQFHCTLVFAAPKKESLVVEASWPGRIARIPQGDNEFGYDPLFIPQGMDISAAQLSESEKNQVSHRALALNKLQNQWQAWLEGGD